MAVCWSQWQASSIFHDVCTPLPHLECRWLRSVRSFLASIQGSIRLDNAYTVEGERTHDIHIIEYAQECGLFTDEDIIIINYCRLYLHLTTVSELLDADGQSIIPSLFHCRHNPQFNPSTYVTLQRRPSDYQVRHKWQRLCREWFDSQGHLARSMRFGNWTKTGERLRRRRQTYTIMHDSRIVYHWKYGCHHEYRQLEEHSVWYHPIGPTEWVPTEGCVPIKVHEHAPDNLIFAHAISNAAAIPYPPHPITFADYVHTQKPWVQHLMGGIRFLYSPYEIIHHVHKHNSHTPLYLVSDGSQRDQNITYGWVFDRK